MLLIFNILIFFVILNVTWFIDKIKGKPNNKTISEIVTVPLLLGIALTIVDNSRISIIGQLLFFVILSLIIFMFFNKYKKFIKRKKS